MHRLRPWTPLLCVACGSAPEAGDKTAAADDTAAAPAASGDSGDPDPTTTTAPWPDPAELPDGTVSLVYEGAVLTDGQTVSVHTPPAGLPALTTLRFVLTNRTDAPLALPTEADAWIDSGVFALEAPPPASLAPEESTAIALTLDVQAETAAVVHTAALTVPAGPTVHLEATVPRPLRVVVVGTGGYTAISDSYGAAFETELHPADGTTARDLVWGGGRFLRADRAWDDWSAPGVYQWSEDGLTWHASVSSEDFWVSDCAHGWGRFYCVRSSSWTSSDDGAVVLHDATGWGPLLNGVAFVPGAEVGRPAHTTDPGALIAGDRLVAVGRDGRRLLSDDGASWTADVSSTTTSTYLNAVAYGSGRVVAVGGTDSLETAVSADGGETWTETVLALERYASFGTVVHGNGVFLAGANTNAHDQLWRSTDGLTWEGLGRDQLFPIAFVNGWFIAMSQGWREAAVLHRSRDGETWTAVHTAPDGVGLQAAAAEQWEAP